MAWSRARKRNNDLHRLLVRTNKNRLFSPITIRNGRIMGYLSDLCRSSSRSAAWSYFTFFRKELVANTSAYGECNHHPFDGLRVAQNSKSYIPRVHVHRRILAAPNINTFVHLGILPGIGEQRDLQQERETTKAYLRPSMTFPVES